MLAMSQTVVMRNETGKTFSRVIKEKCLDCVGNVRSEVRDCAATDCPLFPLSVRQETRGGNQGTTKILHRQGGKAGKGWIAPWKGSSYHQNRTTNWNYFSRPLGASTHNGRYSVL